MAKEVSRHSRFCNPTAKEKNQVDSTQVLKGLNALSKTVKDHFPKNEGVHHIIRLPLGQYQALARDCPDAVLPGEPFIEFSVGTSKIIFMSDEAMLLAAQTEMGEGNSNDETSPESGTKLGQQ